MIENVSNTLRPFQEITLDISEANATLSSGLLTVSVQILSLKHNDAQSRGILSTRDAMLKSIERRFEYVETCSALCIACILDPRFKDRTFRSSAAKVDMINKLRDELKVDIDDYACEQPTTSSKVAATLLDQMYDALLHSSEKFQSQDGESCNDELKQFLQEPVSDRKKTDPLDWWAKNCTRYPKLAKLARKYLGAPPTFVPSERVFSTVGQIYDEKRCSLLFVNAEKLCFLNYNLKLLNFEY